MVRLPEADCRAPRDKRVQRINDCFVLIGFRVVPVYALGQTDSLAALADAHAVLRVHVRD